MARAINTELVTKVVADISNGASLADANKK